MGDYIGKRQGLLLTVKCQPINVKGVLGLEDYHFATIMVKLGYNKNHHADRALQAEMKGCYLVT